ncbi:MAG: proton-conducting transporter membrane subunit [Bilophila sp.]
MLQLLLFGCIVFPLLAALAVVFAKDETLRRRIVFTGTGITALSAIGLALYGSFTLPVAEGSSLNPLLTLLDFALLLYILYLALKLKHKLSTGLAIGQIGGMLYLDFFLLEGSHPAAFTGDPLALLMVLVISLIGGVICIFGLGYMHEHEDHLRLPSTRQPRFFFFLLLFLGAMNGLVLCDSLPWVFFFWEVTTLCSFMLISHDGTREARANALRALWMNMLGGLAFVAAMLFLQKAVGTLSIQAVLSQSFVMHAPTALIPLAFLCFAAFTKSAQLPFQSWLCGAMVAPTPVSALLHSSTMVKAGVYLVVRFAPAFAGTMLAGVVALLGAFTFFAASALACGQSNGKKILAYSTIANLGLIISCAGIGTPASISAAMLLIVFHAVSKGLLFLCVGTIEQQIGSRDIEAMRGLYKVMPRTAIITLVGIMTMMLPPFGALLAKWMALEAAAVAPAFMPVLVTLIAFGSALTVLFWARWAGLILGNDPLHDARPVPEQLEGTMIASLRLLLGGAIVLSFCAPWIFNGIELSVAQLFGKDGHFIAEMGVFSNKLGMFAIYPLFVLVALGVWYALRQARKAEGRAHALPYMSGIQAIEDGKIGFNGPLNVFVEAQSSNYYLEAWFGERTLTGKINTIAIVLMVIMLGGLL